MRAGALPSTDSASRLRFVDLFAGLGGFHLALARLGHQCVFASELDPSLRKLYRSNFGIEPAGDIRQVSPARIPAHDILCGGFPCQPFSKAGEQQGFDCPKSGDLFDRVLKIVAHHKPRFVLLENVPNILRHDSGRTWRELLASLQSLGYDVASARLSPHEYGIPQNRERVFIAASANGLPLDFWPERRSTELSIQSVLSKDPADAKALSKQAIDCLEVWQEFLDLYPKDEDLPWFPIWTAEFGATYPFEGISPHAFGLSSLGDYRGRHGRSLRQLPPRVVLEALPSYARGKEKRFPSWKEKFIRLNRELYWRNKSWIDTWLPKLAPFSPSQQKLEWNCKGEERRIWNCLIQFRASGVRVKRPTAAPTLVAMTTTQVPVIGWERRFMTARECARLQSMHELEHLPETAEQAFRALGNAVNADLVEMLAKRLLRDGTTTGASKTAMVRETRLEVLPKLESGTINIRPGVSVLSVLRHLNYQPWFALAEFVDNAIQSFTRWQSRITKVERKAKLRVEIQIDPEETNRIVIRDNAGGIHQQDYARAFRTAEVPPDRSGLSEFGMGMKSAACWFAPRWYVRTSAIGEAIERKVCFDISTIVRDQLDELAVETRRVGRDDHYTEVVLCDVYRIPQNRTIGKIKSHLASIYRCFLRNGTLELSVNGERLDYATPAVLTAPFFRTPNGRSREWSKPIDIDLGGKKRVQGFAALRETGSTSEAGFALFRRGRLIQGSGEDAYRPEFIFGKSNSFVFQRLFGELHLEGFDVSHTKDGFRWEEAEDDFLHLLREELDREPLALLHQAREYRMKPKREEVRAAAEAATRRTATTIEKEVPAVLPSLAREAPTVAKAFARGDSSSRRVIRIERNGTPWEVTLETTDDPGVSEWVETFDLGPERGVRRVGVRMSLAHPFTERFGGSTAEEIEPLLRMAAALGIAELTARECGVKRAGLVRSHVNELLSGALSKV